MKSQGRILVAAVLAALQAGWSIFQWRELIDLRSGGEAFCFGGGGGCAQLWDSPLASAVHAATGLPVAGWGLVWGIAAAALPLWVWWRLSNGREAAGAWSATMLTAAAGTAVVIGLVGSLFFAGTICSTCAVTYLLVLAYAGCVFFFADIAAKPMWPQGAAMAAAATLLAYLALLYPGLQTPPSATSTLASLDGRGALEEWVDQLSPPVRQGLANSLAEFAVSRNEGRSAPVGHVLGAADAPVHITDFSDIRCGHCASLHKALERLIGAVPRGQVSLEARFFPLDGTCNPLIPDRSEDPVRCAAAKALICVQDPKQAFALSGAMFEDPDLDAERVTLLAERYLPRTALLACMESAATGERLQRDIEHADQLEIRGTPLVLVNGRVGSSYPPFLYAIAMASGRADDAAFRSLPTPRFEDAHRGHNH